MAPVSARPRTVAPPRAAALAALLLLAARRAPPPTGELVLDAHAPVIDAVLAGVPVRLRVDLGVEESVELNPAVAARLPVKWQRDATLEIGRVELPSRVALAPLAVHGVTVPVSVTDHGRDCCDDADGAVGPGLLPYASVRWRRDDAPPSGAVRTLPLDWSPTFGYSAPLPDEAAGVSARFDLAAPTTSATAAAGARLARAWGGAWAGPPTRLAIAFGVDRPVRPLAFRRPGTLAGFPVPSVAVRLADYAGHGALPTDPAEPGDVVVRRRVDPQHPWPAVTFGADRLARCRDIRFTLQPLALTLACAFA